MNTRLLRGSCALLALSSFALSLFATSAFSQRPPSEITLKRIMADQDYSNTAVALRPGDQIVFYTDGITEARNGAGEMFGPSRLDHALHDCHLDSEGLIAAVLETLAEFTSGESPDDDRTMVVAKIR